MMLFEQTVELEKAPTLSISKSEQFLGFLEHDPDNAALILDTAEACLDDDRAPKALELLESYRALSPLPPRGRYLAGLAAMRTRDFEGAAGVFEALISNGETAPAIQFNLAWAHSYLQRYTEALQNLPPEVSEALPQAAMLRVQLLHQLGEFEDAAAFARIAIEQHPDHQGLLAAVSVLALDVEDRHLAEETAQRAGDHPDALTTLATLALGEAENEEALSIFNRVIEINQNIPRSWIGRGLAHMASGEHAAASNDLDRGAEMFGSHLGSWIAAGWSYFVQQDYALSRERFQKALELDPTFAESHGSLAVISVIEGELDTARQLVRVAQGLDKDCFSAALAQSLIASGAGKDALAEKIVEKAFNTPIDDDGRTISDMLIKMGLE